MNRAALVVSICLVTIPFSGATLPSANDVKYVSGPYASVMSMELGAIGIGKCQEIDDGIPFACNSRVGDIPPPNSAFFIIDGSDNPLNNWNSMAASSSSWGRKVSIHVEQIDGIALDGFAAAAGSDVDDDGFAHNQANSPDEMEWAFAGRNDEVCNPPGSSKTCGDLMSLSFNFCAVRDRNGLDDQYDDFIVTIFAWEDFSQLDYGASYGTFRISVEWGAFLSQASCHAINSLVPQDNIPQCSDGLDNDGNGLIDWPLDPNCFSEMDNSESGALGTLPQCSDGIDNNGNGVQDWPQDPGCNSPYDDYEWSPECSDLIDNDGDGETDYPNDYGCDSADDNMEWSPACSDGKDNDRDGLTDYPQDLGCANPNDTDETAPMVH